jgi:Fe-S cluster assembly scaffold protein SufB
MGANVDIDLGKYRLGWSDAEDYVFKPEKGLNEEIIRKMSGMKGEPAWMLEFRLKAYERFLRKPVPTWGGGGLLQTIDFADIYYYIKPTEGQAKSWDMVPEGIKRTYERLGIPEAERKYLAGVTAQYECLRGDVRVYTATGGLKPIKEIVPGEIVFSLDEDSRQLVPTRVKAAAQTGVRQTFRVTVGGRFHRTLHATANHPLLCLVDRRRPGRQRARYAPLWKTVAELCPGDLVAVARDLPGFGESHLLARPAGTPARFPEATNPDFMWLVGLWFGDGSLGRDPRYGTYRVEWAIPESEGELRAEIRRVVGEELGLRAVAGDRWRLTANSKALVDWFEHNSLFGNDHVRRVPQWAFSLPIAERLAFLGGFVDADGYVSPDGHGNALSVTSVNTGLLADVADLAAAGGLRPSGPYRFESKHPLDPERTIVGFRLGIGGDVERLGVRNPRRRERLGRRAYRQGDTSAHGTTFRTHTSTTLGFARVVEIEEADIAPVYDIEIDGPHNFVAEGIVVHNSEVVYHRNRADLEGLGVLFCDMDTALREYPDLVREHFGTVIPPGDNKYAALNSAVWSGGSFIYVPPGVHLDQPLQAYFRINAENMGQFERTLIIVDEGAFCHYVEGCSAPTYSSDSLHAAVVEIIIKDGGRCRYTTIQNWSTNVFNLVTKRAVAHRNATMEWVDGNIGCIAEGSRVTTRGGVKPIEWVTPGEEVLSFDEQAGQFCFRRVNAKRYSGRQAVREVRSGVRALRVTDNHPFYSFDYEPSAARKSGRYHLAYRRADSLERAIVPRTSIDYGHPHKLDLPETVATFSGSNQYSAGFTSVRRRPGRIAVEAETTEDLMWLFGLFLADGSIDARPAANGSLRTAKVTFSVPRADRARDRLLRVMTGVMPGTQPTERADGVTLTWNSVDLAALLTSNGLATGVFRKRVPRWVLDLPESQRLAFIAGFLDGDGCAPRGRRVLSAKSASRELLTGMGEVLTSLGIPAVLTTEFEGERPKVVVGGPSVTRAAHRLDCPPYPRLLAEVSEPMRQAAGASPPARLRWFRRVGRSNIVLPASVEIRKVEVGEVGEEVPTWDIEVEGTGNFVCEGFIVHNSKLTMKYPAVWLMGEGAHGEVLTMAFAGKGQHQDTGAKIIHAAPNTTSLITSKSISKDGGRAGYRGLLRVEKGARNVKSFVRCDALILDPQSRSDTYPYMEIEEAGARIGHEATVSKVGDDQLFYLMTRGLSQAEATAMIVAGFIEPIVRELPMEYAVELNRLIELHMEGSVG